MLATLCPFGMRPHKPGAGIGIQWGSPFFLSSLDMAGTSSTLRYRLSSTCALAGRFLAVAHASLPVVLLVAAFAGPSGARAQSVGDTGGAAPEPAASAQPGIATCSDGVISSVNVDSRPIYDPASTNIGALRWVYRTLNLLHINTTESFIRSELLFEEGDCYDAFLVSESRRLLDQHGFMYVEEVVDQANGSGGWNVDVATRDEWSTKVDLNATLDEGANLERFQVTEENLLGQGVYGEFTYFNRRETKTNSFSVFTPRFFGRSDASVAAGTSRAGNFIDQFWRYPFVGEAGHVGLREGVSVRTDFFAFATGGAEAFSQVLVPVRREQGELSGGYRFGEAGESVILGASVTWDEVTFDGTPEITLEDDFDVRDTLPAGAAPAALIRQLQPSAATRVSLHLGTRRFRYVDYTGLDDLRHTSQVGLGMFAGVTLGKSIGFLQQSGAPRVDDFYARSHFSFLLPVGQGLIGGGTQVEARHPDEGWRDFLGSAELTMHVRGGWLPGQTLFFRASSAGGWNTTIPFQLNLGGREGIRSLTEDEYPGGRLLRFVLEDRIILPWPSSTADLGLTLFSDLGRVWPGDAPYGVDSGWQAGVGFGLRFGLPRGTRNIYRADIAFPVGATSGSPIFRITLEFNQIRRGFFTPEFRRSRRFSIGPDSF